MNNTKNSAETILNFAGELVPSVIIGIIVLMTMPFVVWSIWQQARNPFLP
jgi:hypothetical protein